MGALEPPKLWPPLLAFCHPELSPVTPRAMLCEAQSELGGSGGRLLPAGPGDASGPSTRGEIRSGSAGSGSDSECAEVVAKGLCAPARAIAAAAAAAED